MKIIPNINRNKIRFTNCFNKNFFRKILFPVIPIFIVFLFLTSSLKGQEKKNTITLGGIAAHYINNEKYHLIGPFRGYYKFPVDPGIELLYFRTLLKNTKIGTGINFQKGRVASYMSGLRRFQFYEVSIPVILQKGFTLNEKNSCFFTSGIYSGKTVLQKAATPNSAESWRNYQDFSRLENYSSDVYFIDIYFDAGYYTSILKFADISLAPFFKYRVNPTWLNYHQKKIHFGIKLIYTLKF